jgi:hypothetical protein
MTGYEPQRWICQVISFIIFCSVVIPIATAITLSPGSSTTSPVIAQRDPVSITGAALGHPQNGLQVRVIGNNYLTVTTINVNPDNTYQYDLKKADTLNIATGQYFILIQHPMMNGLFDIVYDAATGCVINRQLGGGTAIFQISGSGSLQNPDSAAALTQAITSQYVDDTFAMVSLFVGNPGTLINPIGNHYVGDRFTINGSTNLAAGDQLLVEIYSASFEPTTKEQSAGFSGATGMVSVAPGTDGINHWSFAVDTSTFRPDEYIVTVSAVLPKVKGMATFDVLPRPVTTTPTPTPPAAPLSTAASLETVASTSPSPVPTTERSPVPVAIAVLAFILLAGIRKMR